MTLIYSTTPRDTDELVALRQVINDNERAFSEIRTFYSVDQRRLCDEYDALMAGSDRSIRRRSTCRAWTWSPR